MTTYMIARYIFSPKLATLSPWFFSFTSLGAKIFKSFTGIKLSASQVVIIWSDHLKAKQKNLPKPLVITYCLFFELNALGCFVVCILSEIDSKLAF